ncbi:MAG: hypothetical protein CMO11_02170 [Thaumarchaeota archaeon]|nr:hypothetical protein [Nitrososphaerota archaeon]
MEKIIHFLASKGRLRVLIEMQSRINLLNRVNCGDVMDLMGHIPSNSILIILKLFHNMFIRSYNW